MNILSYIKARTLPFYLRLISALLFLISDIVYIAIDHGDRTFSYVTFSLILVAALIELCTVFFDNAYMEFVPLVTFTLESVAFAQFLYLGLGTLSDVWNNVNFIGGNATAVVVFLILFGIALLISLVSTFFPTEKK